MIETIAWTPKMLYYGIFLIISALIISCVDTSGKEMIFCWFLVMIGVLSCFINTYAKEPWLKRWLEEYF